MPRLCVLVLLMALTGVAGPVWGRGQDQGHVDTLAHALASDRPMVIALVTRFPDPDEAGETYADWSARLNGFARKHPQVTVIALDREQASKVLAEIPRLSQQYATLFVRTDGKAIVYDGAIVEKIVYAAGLRYLKAPKASVPLNVFHPVEVHFTSRVVDRAKADIDARCGSHIMFIPVVADTARMVRDTLNKQSDA